MRFFSLLTGLAFFGFMMDRPVLGDTAKESEVAAKVKELIHTLRTSTDDRQ